MTELGEKTEGATLEAENGRKLHIPFVASKEICSKPLYNFFNDYRSTFDAFFFMVHLASTADNVSLNASKVLAEGGTEADILRYEERKKNPNPASKRIQKYAWYTSRNLLNTIVESYLTFISSSIQVVLRRVPDAIRSGESIKIDEILDFTSRKELLDYLVERKVNSLSYGGLNAIEKYLQSNLGVSIYRDSQTKLNVLFAIEVRNINSHNRGYANRIFIDRVSTLGRPHPTIGERVHVDLDLLAELSSSLLDSSKFLDSQISSKFKIGRKKFETWKN